MSYFLGIEFIEQYKDYKLECPICKNKEIQTLWSSSSELSGHQFCRECGWKHEIYHKYFETCSNKKGDVING